MAYLKNSIIGAVASCLVAFSSCNKSNNTTNENLNGCDDISFTDSISNSPVYGFVRDAEGHALQNVMVTTGKDTTFTSEDGTYSFENCRAVNGRCVVKFENRDYFSVIRTASIENGEARVDAILMPQDIKEGVTDITRFYNRQGATIKVGKMTITIPANSLVYESDGREFNGSVFASTYYLNPNSENFAKEMPGGDMSGVTSNGKDVILLSYGMVEVTLKDSLDQKLQLRSGAESTMSFPVPDNFTEEQKHNEIPLWYFDEEKGTWIEEGMATKSGDSYTGKVKHFSWHNLDYPELRANICGRVTNKSGKPLPNILVTISQTSARTDNNGNYCAFVPQNTPVFVTVKPSDYANCNNCPIYQVDGLPARTTFTQDIVLPDMPFVHGRVMDVDSFPIVGVSVGSEKSTVITNRKGEYCFYYNGMNPVSLTVNANTLDKTNYKKYRFNDPSEIDEGVSYDFIIARPKYIWGYVKYTNRRYLSEPVPLTVSLGSKEYTIQTNGWGSYGFKVAGDNKTLSAYVRPYKNYGIASEKVTKELDNIYNFMPIIYLPNGIKLSGSVFNTCGPSKTSVTVECGRGKDKSSYTCSSNFGYFDFYLPLNYLDSKAKVKINCQGKRITKKIKLENEDVNLGNIEICTGEKPEPDCIYAIIGDRTVKFDTKKDFYTEMIQRKKSTVRKQERVNNKYQAWYKNPNNKETLILEIEAEKYSQTNKLTVYLVSDAINAESVSSTVNRNLKDDTYTFKTDYELSSTNQEEDSDDVYIYGSATIKNKNADEDVENLYIDQKKIMNKDSKILIGKSNSTQFYTLEVDKDATKTLESELKKKGFKEKSTFRDDEHRISTIFIKDDAEALIHRNHNSTSDMTILKRDGIGKEPLYHCWKVDFRNSGLKKKGGNFDYMWKNEADIAQLVMFGPIMGVEFTKTDISEQKCGCTTSAPAVAN